MLFPAYFCIFLYLNASILCDDDDDGGGGDGGDGGDGGVICAFSE